MRRLALFLIACMVPSLAANAAEEPARPLPISGFSDEATFKLYKNEAQIGLIHYTLTAEGAYTRHFTLSVGGQEIELDFEVATDEDGLWTEMEIVAPTETVTVKRLDAKAEYTLKSSGATFGVSLTDGHILYDSYGPVFESLMLRQYDMETKGEQTFSRFLVPSQTMDCQLEYTGRETRTVNGEPTEFNLFDLRIAGIPIHVWADGEGRIYVMDVPVQYAAYVREGYEELLEDGAQDDLLSTARYDVRRESVMIPMRDGVKLATDLYFPDEKGKKWPVVLVRTPYKKEMEELKGDFWAKRGFVAAIQDCRGRFGSEGIWEPFVNEARDGHDTIEWLGTREWSDGKVGMIGASYVGWVQLWAAAAKPEHLVTIIPNVAPPDPFYNIPYEYGTFFILGSIWWAEILETEATGDLSGKALARIGERKYEEVLKTLPVIELDKQIFEKENRYWREWIRHNTNDEYWEPANFMERLPELDLPVFLQSGWFDGDGIGSKLNYMALKRSRNPNIKLVLGPWGHTDQSATRIGEYDFGDQAALDLQRLYVRWLDHWLKGVDNGVLDEPLVQVFTMFSNRWLEGDSYPLPGTRFEKLYLGSETSAATSRGDGRLEWSAPTTGRPFDRYVYDPGDPTPWPSYYYKSEQEIEEEKKGTVDTETRRQRQRAFHNSVTDTRKDILVYRTEPLEEPLTIAGPVSAVLYASTSAVDTDWFVTLLDVDEEGDILQLARGTVRARFRNSTKTPELLNKNEIYEYAIDLWQTGITFQPGHRIRVEIASALFPAFSRNLNTGGHNEVETRHKKAKQRIHHSEEYPSHILLPVVDLEE